MSGPVEVPEDIVEQVRTLCLALPDRAYAEDERDLAECAETYARAAALAKGSDQDHILSGLDTVSIERYRRSGDAAHLQAALDLYSRALEACSPTAPQRSIYLSDLGTVYRLRYLNAGQLRDLERAIASMDEAIALTEPNAPGWGALLTTRGLLCLDAVVVWPRLWLLLPADTRSELSQARSALDSAVASLIWGLLFIGFTVLAWWALPVAVVVVLAMYLYWIPDRAAVFADLLESAFDIHRSHLYRSQRWPLPENPRDEHASGEQITSYLMRGLDGATPTFTSDTGDS